MSSWPARRATTLLLLAAVCASVVPGLVRCQDGATYNPLGSDKASKDEEALAQMTLAFSTLAGHAIADAAAKGGAGAAAGAVKERQAMAQMAAQLAEETWGKGMVDVDDKGGKLNINLGPLLSPLLHSSSGPQVSAAAGKAQLGVGLGELLSGAELRDFQKALSADFNTSITEFMLGATKSLSSVLVNEAVFPGAQLWERYQQLQQIFAELQNEDGEACGAYEFNPGGAPVNAEWTGPTFTLTQTTGNCALVDEVAGEGNTDWTRLVGRLACLGPSTQYGFTPITYQGVSREPESLKCPECKFVYKFGPEIDVTLYGGKSKDPIVFNSEKEFYAAMVVNKTFDFQLMEIKTVLENMQSQLAKGKLQLHDVIKVSPGSTPLGGNALSGLKSLLKKGLGSGQLLQGVAAAQADMAKQLREAFEQRKADWAAKKTDRQWTGGGGAFDATALLNSMKDKLGSGNYLNKGVSK